MLKKNSKTRGRKTKRITSNGSMGRISNLKRDSTSRGRKSSRRSSS